MGEKPGAQDEEKLAPPRPPQSAAAEEGAGAAESAGAASAAEAQAARGAGAPLKGVDVKLG